MKSFLFATLVLAATSAAGSAATIEISNSQRTLTLYEDNGAVWRYKVAVGVPKEQWIGSERVAYKREWPDWRPTPSTRAEHPELPALVPGGPKNPLGARALYLGTTLYRIHGTNNPKSIGRSASGGCFRMRNADAIDLYARVKVGTLVIVKK